MSISFEPSVGKRRVSPKWQASLADLRTCTTPREWLPQLYALLTLPKEETFTNAGWVADDSGERVLEIPMDGATFVELNTYVNFNNGDILRTWLQSIRNSRAGWTSVHTFRMNNEECAITVQKIVVVSILSGGRKVEHVTLRFSVVDAVMVY